MPADIEQFNPRAVVLGRGAREMTQKDLAQAIGVSQPAISQWEKGQRVPDAEHIEKLAEALDVLPTSLTDASVATTTPMFRASGVSSKRDERRIEGRIEQARLAASRILDEVVITPSLPWPSVDDPLSDDSEQAAADLRRVWRVPSGPVDDLSAFIEAAGTVILRVAFSHAKVEAAYAHPRRDATRWILLNTSTIDGARVRLTLAHELGHAVLHHWDAFNVPSEPERERQAFEFSLALLVPADEFILDVAPTKRRWLDFLRLRHKWGISGAALARRAHHLGLINKDAYRNINIERRRRGHWNVEPGEIAIESPTVFAGAVSVLRNGAGWTLHDFATAVGLPPHRLSDLLPEQFADVVAPPTVRLRRIK
jgi:Zn-dependent peptidase ImmA (M78 family)/DNA-binding XRE family transcriptional regulator